MDIVISVGLNVKGEEPSGQAQKTLSWLARTLEDADVKAIGLFNSEWQGIPERCIQVRVAAGMARDLARELGAAATVLGQESIAVINPKFHRWLLIAPDGGISQGATKAEFPILV